MNTQVKGFIKVAIGAPKDHLLGHDERPEPSPVADPVC